MPVPRRHAPPRGDVCSRPALLTGTSSEYLGRRALPKILRERPVVVVLGPSGVGKTCVAHRVAAPDGSALVLGAREVQEALVERVAQRGWSERLLTVRALVLDGPVWLRNRPAAVDALCELLYARSDAGFRTLVCQGTSDASVEELMGRMPAGSLAVIGLRFPKGSRGRLRFARRACDELAIPRTAARSTDLIEPWGYARVMAALQEWKRKQG